MLNADPIVLPAAASDEAKAYLRIAGAEEDALVARLATVAAELCEHFTGQALLARGHEETMPAGGAWRRLAATPVRAIAGVEALPADGPAAALPVEAYAVDIDANGDGWVRITRAMDASRVRVSYEAGLAADWPSVPEALRQGITRLTAHLFAHRDAAEGRGPPAAVSALWRPWRRMRIG
ncbi:hypothetical protein ACFQRC_11555 [Enterovirga sp. GCM10030262]|uniref:head-tail connector protein n=1 Tax=Enterovirga sp. GCM10030262 TaxID=3273391 RepID=UPI00362396CB